MKLLDRPFIGMLLCFVVTSLSAAALMFAIQHPLFEAQARITVSGDTDMTTLLALLRGNVLLNKTVQAVGEKQLFPTNHDKSRQFQKHLKVEVVRNSRLVEIRFQYPNEELAAKTVNTLLKLFARQLKKLDSSLGITFSNEELMQVQRAVVQAETKLAMFRKNAPKIPEQEATGSTELHDALIKQLAEENEKQKNLATDLETLQQQFTALAGDKDDKEAFLQLKLYEHELLRKYKEENSLIASVRKQLAFIEKQLQKNSPASMQQIEKMTEQIVLVHSAASAQEDIVATLQRQLKQRNNQPTELARTEDIPQQLEQELAASKKRLTQLLQQMETKGKTEQITVLEEPSLPLKAIRPNKLRLFAAAICFGLLCCLVLYALRQ
jgi:uncharacterized protein involved in exopolysaccharide biosynthesis